MASIPSAPTAASAPLDATALRHRRNRLILCGVTALVSAGIQSRSWTRLEPWIARGLALPATRQDRFFEDGFQRASILCAEQKVLRRIS